jgi:hypothetical protein
MQQIHRVDDERYIGGVLSFGIRKLLIGVDRMLLKKLGPRFQM